MATIANLRAKFTGDATSFDRTVGTVSRGISKLTVGIGALVGTAGLGAIVTNSLDAADKIQKLRDSTKLSTEFLSAMKQLKKAAIKRGGNAVVNIRSNYKNKESSSTETFKCGAGAIIAGVALIGVIVEME